MEIYYFGINGRYREKFFKRNIRCSEGDQKLSPIPRCLSVSCDTEFCYHVRERDQSKAFPEIICDQLELQQESQGDRTTAAGEERNTVERERQAGEEKKHGRQRKAQSGVVEEKGTVRSRRRRRRVRERERESGQILFMRPKIIQFT